jgi:hypothetical protein
LDRAQEPHGNIQGLCLDAAQDVGRLGEMPFIDARARLIVEILIGQRG